MKKALRVIVPLILVVAVIACCAWYLLVYDREFTKEMLLDHARYLEEIGKYDAAAKVYDLAYFQSSHEDSIALELAEQYRSMGNYTKAERTLYEAISQNPTSQLYAFLCRLYVEQDKLLDAVNMLDAIADPQIKAELDAMRPAVPTPSFAPNFYSQYISVEIQTDAEKLYVNVNGQYPSTEKDAYTGPISLSLGETVLCCLSVSKDGLVSPMGIYGYTIGGVIEKVTFTDPAIESEVRRIIEAGDDVTLFTNDLWAVKEFIVPTDAASYDDLALLTRLESLTMYEAPADVLSKLPEMEYLTELYVHSSQLNNSDIDAIGKISSLTRLALRDCGLSTAATLQPLTKLEYLDLGSNTLRNLTPLSGMSELRELYLDNNAVTDLSAVSDLKKLTVLDISYNSVKSFAPLQGTTSLEVIRASHNQLTSVSELKLLSNLKELDVGSNSIADISAISGCTKMEKLDISSNTVTDITMLDKMPDLHTLNVSNNQIPALPVFDPNCQLVTINASYNLLLNVDSLAGLPCLNTVNVDYNPELTLLDPLDSCPVLIKVNAYGTKVTEVKFLTDKSVVVNYDPTLVVDEK